MENPKQTVKSQMIFDGSNVIKELLGIKLYA